MSRKVHPRLHKAFRSVAEIIHFCHLLFHSCFLLQEEARPHFFRLVQQTAMSEFYHDAPAHGGLYNVRAEATAGLNVAPPATSPKEHKRESHQVQPLRRASVQARRLQRARRESRSTFQRCRRTLYMTKAACRAPLQYPSQC